MVILCVKQAKLDLYLKIVKKYGIFMVCLLNLWGNADPNLQTKFAYYFKCFQNNPILKLNYGIAPISYLPTLKTYPIPGEGGRFCLFVCLFVCLFFVLFCFVFVLFCFVLFFVLFCFVFFAKMRGKMNLKVSRVILFLGCSFLSTGTKTVGGCCNPPSEN